MFFFFHTVSPSVALSLCAVLSLLILAVSYRVDSHTCALMCSMPTDCRGREAEDPRRYGGVCSVTAKLHAVNLLIID